MGRPPLSVEVKQKDQNELTELLSGGIQQVRVVLRALALLQLAQGVSAPRIGTAIPLTAQAIRNLARRPCDIAFPPLWAFPRRGANPLSFSAVLFQHIIGIDIHCCILVSGCLNDFLAITTIIRAGTPR